MVVPSGPAGDYVDRVNAVQASQDVVDEARATGYLVEHAIQVAAQLVQALADCDVGVAHEFEPALCHHAAHEPGAGQARGGREARRGEHELP